MHANELLDSTSPPALNQRMTFGHLHRLSHCLRHRSACSQMLNTNWQPCIIPSPTKHLTTLALVNGTCNAIQTMSQKSDDYSLWINTNAPSSANVTYWNI